LLSWRPIPCWLIWGFIRHTIILGSTAKQVAELVFAEVYKHHGLPRIIVSNRDPLFMSHFWQELHKLIGTKLNMSSTFHSESDGAMEHANKMIGQML
jgi:hypothetical protein